MNNKNNANLKYLEIKTIEDLEETIIFLEKNFKWNKAKSDLLLSKMPITNGQLNVHGFMIKANKMIVGAILFFHQGYLIIGNEKKTIINLSGWYILEKFRGLPTINFLKHLLKRFEYSILTNYSANKLATKILLAIGFKKMKLKRFSLLLPECIFNFSKIKIKDIPKDTLKIENSFLTNIDEGLGIFFLELAIDQNYIQLIIKKRILRRSLCGIKFNWRTSTIVWSSDEALISKYWKSISNKLLFHTKSMKLICDFSCYFPEKANKIENDYLFFSDDNSIDYIWPIQSEMNFFD